MPSLHRYVHFHLCCQQFLHPRIRDKLSLIGFPLQCYAQFLPCRHICTKDCSYILTSAICCVVISPCGGGLKYLHLNPCESQEATKRVLSSLRWGSNVLQVLQNSDNRQTALQITDPSSSQRGRSIRWRTRQIAQQRRVKRKIWSWDPKGVPDIKSDSFRECKQSNATLAKILWPLFPGLKNVILCYNQGHLTKYPGHWHGWQCIPIHLRNKVTQHGFPM
jgi:hypothetical protein